MTKPQPLNLPELSEAASESPARRRLLEIEALAKELIAMPPQDVAKAYSGDLSASEQMRRFIAGLVIYRARVEMHERRGV